MKIRSDFVTNSSSSSFVAYGILSKELVSFLGEITGDWSASCSYGVGDMSWFDGNIVNITTELYEVAEGRYHIGDHEFDMRTRKQREQDGQTACRMDYVMNAVRRCMSGVELKPEQEKQIRQLVKQSLDDEMLICDVYEGQTDGWSPHRFFREDFENRILIRNRNGEITAVDDHGSTPRTYSFDEEKLRSGLFQPCRNTAEIELGLWVKLEKKALAGCVSLKRLDMSGREDNGEVDAFLCEGCTALETVILPTYAYYIGERAFAGCRKLRDIKIPDSVFCIHPTAFEGCDALPEETRRVIASLTSEKSLKEWESETLAYVQSHGATGFKEKYMAEERECDYPRWIGKNEKKTAYRTELARVKRLCDVWWSVYGEWLNWPETLLSWAVYGVYAEKGVEIEPPRPQWQSQKTIGKKMRYMIVDAEKIPDLYRLEAEHILGLEPRRPYSSRLDKAIELKKQGSGIQILTKAHFEKLVAAGAYVETDPKTPDSQKAKAGKVEPSREEESAIGGLHEKPQLQKTALEDERSKRVERWNREHSQAIAVAMADGRAVGRDTNVKVWMDIYGGFLDQVSSIDFNGKLFVFTGVMDDDLKLIEAVLERGGQKRTSVSGRTDYLVINTMGASAGKIEDAIAQKEKGSGIQVVTVDMLRAALEGKEIPVVYKPARQPDAKNEEKPVVGETVTQKALAEADEQQVEKGDQPAVSALEEKREEAAAAERRRQAAAREAEERKRREAEEQAARKRREAAAREQELEREKSQLQEQRDVLQKERDAIKGLFVKVRKAKLEPQIAEIEAKLAQMEEELKSLRAMER